jgi:hypothetical protein
MVKSRIDSAAAAAKKQERAAAIQRLNDLEGTVEQQVITLNEKLRSHTPLTVIPPVEFGVDTYQEVEDIRDSVRASSSELRRLVKVNGESR